jgi:uncharacterized protein
VTLTHDDDVVRDPGRVPDDRVPDDTMQTQPERRPGLPARVLLVPVNLYRAWISPVLPPSCRFEPSCSAYAVEALSTHGALRGCYLTVRRLLRCGPWHPGGYDPVPPRRARRARRQDVTEGSGANTSARDTLPKE